MKNPGLRAGIVRLMVSVFMLAVLGIFVLIGSLLPKTSLAKSYDMHSVQVNATVHTDGSLEVEEQRTFDFDGDFNGVYWVIDHSDSNGVMPFEVKRVSYVDSKGTHEITTDAYSDIHYVLINDGQGKTKVKIYRPSSDESVRFSVSYVIGNAVRRYQDTSVLYWKFIPEGWERESKDIQCTINLPAPAGTPQAEGSNALVRAWGHGPLNGELSVTNHQVSLKIPSVDSGEFAETRIMFPADWLSAAPIIPQKKSDEILKEEKKWADEANARRTMARTVLAVSSVVSFVAPLGAIACAIYAKLKNKKIIKNAFNEEYLRDVPTADNPVVYAFLDKLKSNLEPGEALRVSAMRLTDAKVLKLIDYKKEKSGLFGSKLVEGYKLVFDKSDDSSVQQLDSFDWAALKYLKAIAALDKESEDNELDLNAIPTISKTQEEDFIAATQQYSEDIEQAFESTKYMGAPRAVKGVLSLLLISVLLLIAGLVAMVVTFAFMDFNSFTSSVLLTSVLILGVCGLTIIAIVILITSFKKIGTFRLSQKGLPVYAQLQALKRWFNDFTLLKEAIPQDVVIWNRLLVAAVALGVSEKVLENLKSIAPEILEDDYIGPVYSWLYISRVGSPLDTLGNHVSFSYSTAVASSMSSSGGGGGGFSGGGGGGFGGGGGGGAF